MVLYIVPRIGFGSRRFSVKHENYEKLSYSAQCKLGGQCKYGLNCKYYHTTEELHKFVDDFFLKI